MSSALTREKKLMIRQR